MSEKTAPVLRAECACGSVALELRGTPIVGAVCYCDDCQAGGRQIEALPQAPPVLDADGGTQYLLYRKDRVQVSRGADRLSRHKLREKTITNRAVAGCCNTAMLVDFDGGPHWVSVYRARVAEPVPPLEMRINTKFKPAGVELRADLPTYATAPFGFIWRLIKARGAMLIGR